MAKVKAPFLSLGATGQLGKTIVMSTWKGIKTAREYVVPANPRSLAQVAQRALMTLVTAYYKTTLTASAMRTGWNLSATLSGKPQSGYNAFSSAALTLLGAQHSPAPASVMQLWVGTTPTNLALVASADLDTLNDSIGKTLTAGATQTELIVASLADPATDSTVTFAYVITTAGYAQVRNVAAGISHNMTGVVAVTPA